MGGAPSPPTPPAEGAAPSPLFFKPGTHVPNLKLLLIIIIIIVIITIILITIIAITTIRIIIRIITITGRTQVQPRF